MGFSFMEAFMDKIEVSSESGKGTRVIMEKKVTWEIVLSYGRDKRIIKAYERRRSGGEREDRALDNMGLIWSVVKRFTGRGHEPEDSVPDREHRTFKGSEKFDLSYDVKFSTYAVPMITGEIKRFLRDDGMIKVSRSLKEIAYQVRQAGEAFAMKYNREATIDELSRETKIARIDRRRTGGKKDVVNRFISQAIKATTARCFW